MITEPANRKKWVLVGPIKFELNIISQIMILLPEKKDFKKLL